MIRVVSLALLVFLLAGCALIREGNPVTTGGAGYGPCKSWVDCGAADGPENRCCPPRMACARDDGGPYCAADEGWSGDDPTTWGARTRVLRTPAPGAK